MENTRWCTHLDYSPLWQEEGVNCQIDGEFCPSCQGGSKGQEWRCVLFAPEPPAPAVVRVFPDDDDIPF